MRLSKSASRTALRASIGWIMPSFENCSLQHPKHWYRKRDAWKDQFLRIVIVRYSGSELVNPFTKLLTRNPTRHNLACWTQCSIHGDRSRRIRSYGPHGQSPSDEITGEMVSKLKLNM
jgi:hypothetical protein